MDGAWWFPFMHPKRRITKPVDRGMRHARQLQEMQQRIQTQIRMMRRIRTRSNNHLPNIREEADLLVHHDIRVRHHECGGISGLRFRDGGFKAPSAAFSAVIPIFSGERIGRRRSDRGCDQPMCSHPEQAIHRLLRRIWLQSLRSAGRLADDRSYLDPVLRTSSLPWR